MGRWGGGRADGAILCKFPRPCRAQFPLLCVRDAPATGREDFAVSASSPEHARARLRRREPTGSCHPRTPPLPAASRETHAQRSPRRRSPGIHWAPAFCPAVPGAAGAQQAGRRQGGRGQEQHREKARAAGIRPMARGCGGAGAAGMPGTRAGSVLPAARPPRARTLEGGSSWDLRVSETPRLKVAPVEDLPFQTSDPVFPNAFCC